MRTTLIAVLAGLAMIGTSVPIDAAENVKVNPAVELPGVVKMALKAMPKSEPISVGEIVAVSDTDAVVVEYFKLFPGATQEQLEMAKMKVRQMAAFTLGNSFPIYVNVKSKMLRQMEASYREGQSVWSRAMSAVLCHERLHAFGEQDEGVAYDHGIAVLDDLFRKGHLAGAEAFYFAVKRQAAEFKAKSSEAPKVVLAFK